jgi:hypothetical protein
MTIKYKHNNPKIQFLFHCFPEAQTIIREYLNKGCENATYKDYSIDLHFVDGFPEKYSIK